MGRRGPLSIMQSLVQIGSFYVHFLSHGEASKNPTPCATLSKNVPRRGPASIKHVKVGVGQIISCKVTATSCFTAKHQNPRRVPCPPKMCSGEGYYQSIM